MDHFISPGRIRSGRSTWCQMVGPDQGATSPPARTDGRRIDILQFKESYTINSEESTYLVH